ncbi:hypothetical protein Tco_0244633, partial [Tanacetum coccineum]
MDLYTSLSKRVLDLENVKTAQALEITGLKKRVRVKSSAEASLDKEDASKKERSIADRCRGVLDEEKVIAGQVKEVDVAEKEVSTAGEAVTATPKVSIAGIRVSTTSASVNNVGVSVTIAMDVDVCIASPIRPVDDSNHITLAETLMAIKSSAS